MKEQLISFETAKLAKGKGFNEKCLYEYYDVEDSNKMYGVLRSFDDAYSIRPMMSNSELHSTYTAPTQSVLQKWLREEYDYNIEIIPENDPDIKHFIWWPVVYNMFKMEETLTLDVGHTYEEALECALHHVLSGI